MPRTRRGGAIGAATCALMLIAGCGQAVDSDAEPVPADVEMPAVDIERDDVAITDAGDENPASCNVDRVDPYVGMQADYETRAEMLEKVAPLVNVRWLSPDDQRTEDREMQRLTVELSEDGEILAVRCG